MFLTGQRHNTQLTGDERRLDFRSDALSVTHPMNPYDAVIGQAAWDNNARLRKAGERRILKKVPPSFTISWSEWKKTPGVFAEP
jgi:hypothetical protein